MIIEYNDNELIEFFGTEPETIINDARIVKFSLTKNNYRISLIIEYYEQNIDISIRENNNKYCLLDYRMNNVNSILYYNNHINIMSNNSYLKVFKSPELFIELYT